MRPRRASGTSSVEAGPTAASTAVADPPAPSRAPGYDASHTTVEHGTEELPILGAGTLGSAEVRTGQGADSDLKESSSLEKSDKEVELDEVNSFVQNTMSLGKVTPPVQGFPDMTVSPERIYPGSAGEPASRARRFGDVVRPGRREAVDADKSSVIRPRLRGLDLSRPRVSISSVRMLSGCGVPPASFLSWPSLLLWSSWAPVRMWPQATRRKPGRTPIKR